MNKKKGIIIGAVIAVVVIIIAIVANFHTAKSVEKPMWEKSIKLLGLTKAKRFVKNVIMIFIPTN